MSVPGVTVIIPVKGGPEVKSRLHPDPVVRSAFARAFALDTAAAALAATQVGCVVVVTSDVDAAADFSRLGCQVVREQPTQGSDPLNAAIAQARDWATQQRHDQPLAVLPGDLPALTPAVLDDALIRARAHRLAFCTDAQGLGTTLLVAARPTLLTTAYGPGSALKHRAAGAFALQRVDRRLRQDIDTMDGLCAAERLGVGTATTAMLADHALVVGATG